ncbi:MULTISPECIES: TetR/AcrR family transcriptional regulator [Actinomadura]|uniref:TetR family transcriptional regulator n=1 Tax=Actinomadura litoris TaxID=2678616 RepID=A0A7K1L805_9ACTN|nr:MULTISPECIES: TetR/AcrR family transcriptional regulator [Actinomadura]MBT2210460.1 TetR/AcrR family transcriptional regulator [Actinomadura sp. NEAU-AAG7]MUN40549.1 TetR family transcriptional regulator [Actinomadura litoris]
MSDTHGPPEGDGRVRGAPPSGTGGRPPDPAVPPARRGRREQTRARLLGAAERLWAERGIHGASLDDIAAAAGLTKGAVYSNFAGKTDLLLALLDRFTHDRAGHGVLDDLESAAPDDAESPYTEVEERARRIALLMVEFWLYGMRDYAAGWRIADWYAERRAHLARDLPEAGGVAAGDRAVLALAMEIGLPFQHLLDPERVPAHLQSVGLELLRET